MTRQLINIGLGLITAILLFFVIGGALMTMPEGRQIRIGRFYTLCVVTVAVALILAARL